MRVQSQLAAQYAERGQWSRAQAYYQQARRGLGDLEGETAIAARAALDLSLGSVLVQAGELDRAKTF